MNKIWAAFKELSFDGRIFNCFEFFCCGVSSLLNRITWRSSIRERKKKKEKRRDYEISLNKRNIKRNIKKNLYSNG